MSDPVTYQGERKPPTPFPWRPIATAPRDRTRILVWRPHAIADMRRIGVDFWDYGAWQHSRPVEQPTHWMHVSDMAPDPAELAPKDAAARGMESEA